MESCESEGKSSQDMGGDQLASSMQELCVGSPPRDDKQGRDTGGSNSRRCCREMGEGTGVPHLPDEVVSTILAFLPVISILRCRLVGKRWNSISQEGLFRKTYARVSGELSRQYLELVESSGTFAGSQVVSSAGGLLLVTTFAEPCEQIYVINPMAATLKQIPTMLCSGNKPGFSAVGMVIDSETNVYKILASDDGARPVRFQLYDSSCGLWQWAGSWAVRQPWSASSSTSSVLTYITDECVTLTPVSFHVLRVAEHQGNLHCLAVSAARHLLVLRFDAVSSTWSEVRGLFPPTLANFVWDFRCRPVLFESGDRLMLAGAQVTGPTSLRLNVWAYEGSKAEWEQVACARQVDEDDDVCSVAYSDDTFFYLDASLGHLCLGAFPSFRNPDPKVLVYRLSQGSLLLSRLLDEEVDNKLVHWQKRAWFYEPNMAGLI